MKSFNVDFEGVMPGTDQAIYDAMNEKCLTSQCLTDKGRALLEEQRKVPADMSYNPKFKLTDLHGGRGVICKVWPEDMLPKEEPSSVVVHPLMQKIYDTRNDIAWIKVIVKDFFNTASNEDIGLFIKEVNALTFSKKSVIAFLEHCDVFTKNGLVTINGETYSIEL